MSINRINYYNFELDCITEHKQKYNQITYHWNDVPEQLLEESGFITDYNKFRLLRKKNFTEGKINNIQEYGLDGISVQLVGDKKIYHGLHTLIQNVRFFHKYSIYQ